MKSLPDSDSEEGRKPADRRHARGLAGEELARGYLERRGYDILEMNLRSRYGEIDIIARQGSVIAFIEVKTRLGDRHGEPFEAVGARKQGQLRRMAQMWLAARSGDPSLRECEFRFDVISVKMDDRREQFWSDTAPEGRGIGPAPVKEGGIEHLEDAFR